MIDLEHLFIATGLIFFAYLGLNGYLFLKDKKLNYIYKFGLNLIPLFMAIAVNQTYLSNKGANAVSRAATISLDKSDGSINKDCDTIHMLLLIC